MSYKSYAQGGQFNTYSIDLPIKTEINEDLRAAGDFSKQMERSQQYREKWAQTYLAKLNNKSSIERQNRDDNFGFLQNNFKAIYEGEQREFEGRLAELKREQAEAAQAAAEPSTIEKVFSFMQAALQVAGTVEGIVEQQQAVQLEQQKEAAGVSMEKMSAHGFDFSGGTIGDLHKRLILGSSEEQALALTQIRQDHSLPDSITDADILNTAGRNGDLLMHNQTLHFQQSGARNIQLKMAQETFPGGNGKYDPSRPEWLNKTSEYTDAVEQYRRELRKEELGPELSSQLLLGVVIPEETKQNNTIFNQAAEVWGRQSAAARTQLKLNRVNVAAMSDNPTANLDLVYNQKVDYFLGDHNKASQEMYDLVTAEGSFVSASVYETWLNKHIAKSPALGGPRQALLRSALIKLEKKGHDSMTHLNNVNTAKSNTLLNEYKLRLSSGPPDQRYAARQELAGLDKTGLTPEVQKELNYLSTPQGMNKLANPTQQELTGVTAGYLKESVDTALLPKVSRGAYYEEHGKTAVKGESSFRITSALVQAEVMRIWGETEKNFPGFVGNKEIILQKSIDQALENLFGGSKPRLAMVNEDLTDPTAPITFNVNLGGKTTADFYNQVAQYKDSKTIPKGKFPELTGGDGARFDRFALIRSRVKGGPVEFQHVQVLANSQWANELSKEFGITKFEAIDLGLRSRGHDGLHKDNLLTSAELGIESRRAADLIDGLKTVNAVTLEAKAQAVNGTLGQTPAPHARAFVAHLKPGSTAQAAHMGNTGNSRGEHYHIGAEDNYGNPQGLIDARNKTVELGDALAAKGSGFTFTNSQVHISSDEWNKLSIEDKHKYVEDEQLAHSSRHGGGSPSGIDLVSDLNIPFPLPIVEGSVGDRRDGFGITGTF